MSDQDEQAPAERAATEETAATADPPAGPLAVGRGALLAVALGIAALGAASLWQASAAPRPVHFPGARGLSGPWRAPPADSGRWLVSEGIAPPASSARAPQLRGWLAQHYPVLALPDRGAAPWRDEDSTLELGGGPPRTLFVEPGAGLVMREP